MGKRARKHSRDFDFDPYDDFDDLYDDDLEKKEFARDIYSTEWGDHIEKDKRISSRRQIERRNEMKKLYSQLDDFEEFGEHSDW